MQNISSLSWACFEANNQNKENAFEAMCRSIFKKTFFSDDTIFHSNPNHPGIEIEPLENKTTGKRISFQAKYFETAVGYSQIKTSAITAVKYYFGKIDILYLYCNKDVTTTCTQYKEIISLLNAANIELVPVTNQEILNCLTDYTGLATYYFHKHGLIDEWFKNHINGSLEDLGQRYNGRFNIDTQTEYYLDLFVGHDAAIKHINQKKADAKESLDKSALKHGALRPTIEKASKFINSLSDVRGDNLRDCLEWGTQIQTALKPDLGAVEIKLSELSAELKDDKIEKSAYAKKRNEINDLEWLCNIPDLISINPVENTLLNSKILILRGEAGTGKSQLFATTAKNLLEAGPYAILLLGQSFLSDTPVAEQIVSRLGLNYEISELFNVLEEIGDRDNQNIVIFIDALNESENKNIWKTGLGQLIRTINEYRHLKLAVSVRSGYEPLVLAESVCKKLESNEIANLVHAGFRDESLNAIQDFMNHYGVPFSPENYFNYEMTNPLYLTLLCETYDGNDADLFSLFDRLIRKVDIEAQRAIGLDGYAEHLVDHLIDEMAERQLESGKYSISQQDIYRLDFWKTYGCEGQKIIFLSAIKRSGLFLSFVSESQEYCCLSYNLLDDFSLARVILRKYPDKGETRKYLHDQLLGIRDGKITEFAHQDVFIAVCGLFAEKFNEECIDIIDDLTDCYEKQKISDEYIHAYLWRKKEHINKDFFLNFINKYNVSTEVVFPVLIDSAVKRNHPLNAVFLHHILLNKTLAHRDYLWTIYINNIVNEENRLSNLIIFINKGGTIDESNAEMLWLFLVLLGWILTSSNRFLRDTTSKAMIEILKRHFEMSLSLLRFFEEVNDPYVIQRLYGVVFGACVKRIALHMREYADLVEYIIDAVFKKEYVYPDILMRDYARLIIERYIFEFPDALNNADINAVRPPYRSKTIPVVQNEEYYTKDAKESGLNRITFSMSPNHKNCGLGMYGDFGRYVFQAAISKFEDADIVNLYHYAMQFIRDELGYDDHLFGRYDCFSRRTYYGRTEVKKTERIGKKYQWITFYNILARLSDTCLVKEWGEDCHSYGGPWEPYVRDFDPTMNCNNWGYQKVPFFVNNQSFQKEFLLAPQNKPEIREWTRCHSPVFSCHANRLILTDSVGKQWVSLFDSQEEKSEKNTWSSSTAGPTSGSQMIWTISRAYFVDRSNLDTFKNLLKCKNMRGIDLPESNSVYQLFNREYCWSPSVSEIFGDEWYNCEIETGEEVLIHHEDALPKIYMQGDGNDLFDSELFLKTQGWNQTERIKMNIGKIAPAFGRYLWEEEYDASQKDTTAFYIPCNLLLAKLKLEQKNDGYFFTQEGVLAAFDGSLQNSDYGLIIRKDLLDKFLEENSLSLLWSCIGEKQYFLGNNEQIWGEWSGLFYLDGDKAAGQMQPQER